MKILIGSSIYQKPLILKEFLESLLELESDGLEISYLFIDDNKDDESSKILLDFQAENNNVTLYGGDDGDEYKCDDYTHHWNDNIINKVTKYKNFILYTAGKMDYDYLFILDSDLILHKKTLKRLIKTKRDIISNIFWTKWNKKDEEKPQVWQEDSYSFHISYGKEAFTKLDAEKEKIKFFEMLKEPGTYKVGGLGACTLISKKVLKKPEINYSRLYNLSFWGEDRHFSIRAVSNGFELYVDTFYPAYHIYREEDLLGVTKYKKENERRDIDNLTSQLFSFLKEGVRRINSHKNGVNDESYKLFFSDNGIKISKIQDEFNVEEIQKSEVLSFEGSFNEEFSKLSGKVIFIEKGYINNESYFREYLGEFEITAKSIGVWKIEKFEKIEERVVMDMPIKRFVKSPPRLTLSMVVRNEEGRYLKECLEKAREYIDEAVIIDDCSTDNTVEIVKEALKGIKLTLIQNNESSFKTEWKLRKHQWDETIKTNPDWILFLDADEIFEDRFKDGVKELMVNQEFDCYNFRLYDMWDMENYRSDNLWYAHKTFRSFLIRYQKNFNYEFTTTNQHCGRMPNNVMSLLNCNCNLRLKHYGWAREEDRKNKYDRYKALDKDGVYGNLEQYESILDENPYLEKWIE